MVTTLQLGEITVDVVMKDIKNLHLSVYPPTGRVRISAPLRMNLNTIRIFAISKIAWIKQHQGKVNTQERESPREFINRESHYVWGKRYLLERIEKDAPPLIDLQHSKLILQVRPGTPQAKRQELLDEWYRALIKQALPKLLSKWQPLLGVEPNRVYIQRMKTKWGSCSPTTGSIRLNTDLARKPKECLEYIVVHELAHLIEPTHNHRFTDLMDRLLPNWRTHRETLNRLPLRHVDWVY